MLLVLIIAVGVDGVSGGGESSVRVGRLLRPDAGDRRVCLGLEEVWVSSVFG